MSVQARQVGSSIVSALQTGAIALVLLAGAGALLGTLLAAFGVVPWLTAPLAFGDVVIPEGGLYLQVGLTAILVTLALYLPANRRIARLEHSHRDFRIAMEDVARAYAAVHKADREGYFRLDSEFENVRQRFAFLREHPELDTLEPEILEVAAQMSTQSADLAERFSLDKVERAQTFLKQRLQEVATFESRLESARAAIQQLSQLQSEVTYRDEAAAEAARRLDADLREALSQIGYDVRRRPGVVQMPTAAE